MNVLYLIGNGFDKNIGLKTSYPEFYKSYCVESSGNEHIEKFKAYLQSDEIIADTKLWSDLELVLGKSTTLYEKPEDFESVLLDVNNSLRRYIEEQNNRLQFSPNASDKFIDHLLNPQRDLTEVGKNQLQAFVSKYGIDWKVNFMSFNYTYSIELLLNNTFGTQVGKNIYGGRVNIGSVKHIHGLCDDTILVGVNDESQIENDKFRGSIKLLRKAIKSRANDTIGEGLDRQCEELVRDANLICCFGLSFGRTDGLWWSRSTDVLADNSRKMIIYDHRPEVDRHLKFMIGDYRDEVVAKVLVNNSDGRSKRIIYAIQKDMFSGLSSCVLPEK